MCMSNVRAPTPRPDTTIYYKVVDKSFGMYYPALLSQPGYDSSGTRECSVPYYFEPRAEPFTVESYIERGGYGWHAYVSLEDARCELDHLCCYYDEYPWKLAGELCIIEVLLGGVFAEGVQHRGRFPDVTDRPSVAARYQTVIREVSNKE